MSNIEMGLLWFALGMVIASASKPTVWGLLATAFLYVIGLAAMFGARP